MAEVKEFVTFKLNTEYYGVNINNVENIEKVLPITRVPYTKPFVKGLVNLRGIVVPVVDLRSRFGLEPKTVTDDSRIIMVHLDDYTIGMLVDSSSEVLQMTDEDIDEAPAVNRGLKSEFVQNIGKSNERIIMLIDLYKVLDIDQSE